MQSVFIEVHYTINDMKALRRGYFNVHPKKFRKNPDEAAADVAKQFIREMRREYIYKIEINKVLYDSNDITEIVALPD